MYKLLALLENWKYGPKVAETHKDSMRKVKQIMEASQAVHAALRKKELSLLQEEYRRSMGKIINSKKKNK